MNMNMSMTEREPILEDDGQLCLFPIKYEKLYDMYKQAKSLYWTPEEIDFTKDKGDWDKLDDNATRFLKHVLAFFATSDALVNNNLLVNFSQDIPHQEVKSFYAMQMAQEAIHSETYSILIDVLIDPNEKDSLFNSIHKMPIIEKKAKWIQKWTESSDVSVAERLVAFIAVEGIFFSGSFAAIFWIKQKGLLPGLTASNKLIARDEGLHVQFAVELSKNFINKPSYERVCEILTSAVKIEQEFIAEALPVSMIGMSTKLMSQYIEYVTDRLLSDLNLPIPYNVQNPFDFMNNISLECKTNFFERRATEYRKCPIVDETVDQWHLNDQF